MEYRGIQDTRLIARAIRERWDVPAEQRQAMMRHLDTVILDPNTSDAHLLIASRAWLDAEAQDAEADAQEAALSRPTPTRAHHAATIAPTSHPAHCPAARRVF